MQHDIRIQASPGERRIAVVRSGVMTAYAVWRPGAPDGVGDVYQGRVMARVPALAGSFLALTGMQAFLPDSECATRPFEGQMLTVRITRSAQAGKGPRVTARGVAAAGGDVRLMARGPSPLERLAADHDPAPILVDSAGLLAELRPRFGGRVSLARPVFDEALESGINALGRPDLALPFGMRATLAATAALTAIDVDTGTACAGPAEKAAAQFAANLAAIPELARQIRLRNLSGAILIDFAGMAAKRRQALGPALAAALAEDAATPRLVGFTGLGFAEIVRPRISPPLHEVLAGPHAAGLCALRAAVAVCAIGAARLRAAPAVVSALHADKAALGELAAEAVHPLMLVSDPSLGVNDWRFEDGRA